MSFRSQFRQFRRLPRAEQFDVAGQLFLIHYLKFLFVMGVCISVYVQVMQYRDQLGEQPLGYRDFQTRVQAGDIASVRMSDDSFDRHLYVTARDDTRYAVIPPATDRVLFEDLEKHGISVVMNSPKVDGVLIVVRAIVLSIAMVMVAAFLKMQLGIGSVHETSAINLLNRRPASFDDVVGCDDARAEFAEAIDALKHPERYSSLGAQAPRGLLLYGPPGVGKTLLARAAAQEAGACFISRTASDFNQMYLGLGALKLRVLFAQARRRTPAVIFIDEFETLGRSRGDTGPGWAGREQQATLNQLLAEMDGFNGNHGLLVIAATNYADDIDPALRRPGRFDRQIYIGAPDQKGRRALFELFLAKKPRLAMDIDIDLLARSTPGMAGAQIEGVVNEAALLAAREGAEAIGMAHLRAGRDRLMLGLAERSREVIAQERRVLAIHEAGHAVVAHHLMPERSVERVSITPHGQAGGHTLLIDESDRLMLGKHEIERQLAVLMAGRAAEALCLGTGAVTTGASDDIARANVLARQYCEAGFSERLGLLQVGKGDVAQDTLRLRDIAVRALLDDALASATVVLRGQRPILDRMVDRLIEQEVLERDDVLALLQRRTVNSPGLETV